EQVHRDVRLLLQIQHRAAANRRPALFHPGAPDLSIALFVNHSDRLVCVVEQGAPLPLMVHVGTASPRLHLKYPANLVPTLPWHAINIRLFPRGSPAGRRGSTSPALPHPPARAPSGCYKRSPAAAPAGR